MKQDDSSLSHPSLEQRLLHLLQAVRETHDTSARAELNMLLRENADARSAMARLMVDEQALISRLRDESIVALLELSQAEETPLRTGTRWFAWRPLTAAAAGIVFGMFCTSVVFGFGVRSVEKVMSLLQEGFESGPAPMVTGVPPEPNVWSGDYSEIVIEREGVKPMDGSRMVRLLRSDYEGRTVARPSRQGDLMRVLDVRPFLSDAKGGDLVMTLSARFNAASFPSSEHYNGMVTIYALGAETDLRGATENSMKKDALAFSLGFSGETDRDPDTWQIAATRLLLPPGADRVMVKVSFCRKPVNSESTSPPPASQTFTGHFVDDVRASIRIREASVGQSKPSLP